MTRAAAEAPVSLRVSVTDRCQLRCRYCMPAEGLHMDDRDEVLRYEEIVDFVRVVKSHLGLSKVHLTGGEPLVRSGVADLVAMLASQGVGDLALTTNGQLLSELAGPLARAGLDRVNVSLDSLNPVTYAWSTRGGELRRTLDGLEAALAGGLAPVKINVTVMRGVNSDDLAQIACFGLERGCEVRFLELMPIGPAAEAFAEMFVARDETFAGLSSVFNLRALPYRRGDSARRYAAADGRGRSGIIGFISPVSDPFCRGCRRVRLTATGQLVGCLAVGTGPDIRPALRRGQATDDEQLVRLVRRALGLKRTGCGFTTTNLMSKTGG